jgi:N-acetylglucosaminyldiphosphoundecaprenol N-acetyl-beta-D-mannosaminyltransferase
MWSYLARAGRLGQAVYLCGSTTKMLERLAERIRDEFAELRIAAWNRHPSAHARPTNGRNTLRRIEQSGASVVLVALGCPKQELWMHEQRHCINAVMIGVGAALDFHAGVISRAPRWMQNAGLEWLHRLASEPRRCGADISSGILRS